MVQRWNQILVLDKAVELLMCFTTAGPDLSLAEVARLMDAPKGTVHRIASTLVRNGILGQHLESRKYFLGNLILVLGGAVKVHEDVKLAAQPVIADLVAKTGEGVNLAVVHQLRRLCIDIGEGTQGIRLFTYVGQISPLHAGASAKSLLAYQPEEIVQAVLAEGLDPCTTNTVTDADTLLSDLAAIRQQGYAVSNSERVLGATSIAAPIFDSKGRVIASLSLAGPSYRFPPDRVKELIPLVVDGAQAVLARLGGLKKAEGRQANP